MKKFEVGKTYRYNHAGDHNLWVNCTVIKRTEKTVTFSKHGNEYRVKLRQNENEEFCFPNGIHSMCPVLSATDEVADEKEREYKIRFNLENPNGEIEDRWYTGGKWTLEQACSFLEERYNLTAHGPRNIFTHWSGVLGAPMEGYTLHGYIDEI